MTISFRPAVRENVPMIVGIAGPTGSGKTLSALKLARGLADGDDSKIFGIDTESRRMLHYAPGPNQTAGGDAFGFQHYSLPPPYSPAAYAEAVKAADAGKPRVIVIDQISYEWAGEGGLLDMQEAEMARMAGDDARKREAVKMAAWIKPKMAHKRMMSSFLTCNAHLIFCLRAEEKTLIKRETDPDTGRAKTVIIAPADRPLLERWQPICEKTFMYEMVVSFLVLPTAPGVPVPVKLQAQHRPFFREGQPITEECGRLLADWSGGGSAPPAPAANGTGNGANADDLYAAGEAAAEGGLTALESWFRALPRAQQVRVKPRLDELKTVAAAIDADDGSDPFASAGLTAEAETAEADESRTAAPSEPAAPPEDAVDGPEDAAEAERHAGAGDPSASAPETSGSASSQPSEAAAAAKGDWDARLQEMIADLDSRRSQDDADDCAASYSQVVKQMPPELRKRWNDALDAFAKDAQRQGNLLAAG